MIECLYRNLATLLVLIFLTAACPIAGAEQKGLHYQELHTHFRGALKSEQILSAALADSGITYPAALLEELKISVPAGQTQVPLKSLSQEALLTLNDAMNLRAQLPVDFAALERAYKYRVPLTRFDSGHLSHYEALTRALAKSFADQGVGYAEISGAIEMLHPAWRELMSRLLPEIEKNTGVRLRYLIGIRRNVPAAQMLPLIEEVRRNLPLNPFVVGVDFMGEEVNSTSEFANVISELAKFKRVRPGFQVRVHAGENGRFQENVREAIRAGATRIGHGVYGLDEETLRLAREHNVVIELNPTSNLALGNIETLRQIPVDRYAAAGVRFVVGTDGAAIFRTSISKEIGQIRGTFGNAVLAPRTERHSVFVPGSFDPPTKGHLELFLTAFEKYHADRLVIMLNTVAGPKDYYASFEQRKAMILAALPAEYHSKVEIRREPPGAGAKALLEELTRNPKELILAFVGEDAFKSSSAIPENLRYKVVSRPGQEKGVDLPANAEFIKIEGIEGISSSAARAAIQGHDRVALQKLLPEPVIQLAERDGLYLMPSASALRERQVRYEKAFEEFARKVRSVDPDFPEPKLVRPEFNPVQSPGEWTDKFLRSIRSEARFENINSKFTRGSCEMVFGK